MVGWFRCALRDASLAVSRPRAQNHGKKVEHQGMGVHRATRCVVLLRLLLLSLPTTRSRTRSSLPDSTAYTWCEPRPHAYVPACWLQRPLCFREVLRMCGCVSVVCCRGCPIRRERRPVPCNQAKRKMGYERSGKPRKSKSGLAGMHCPRTMTLPASVRQWRYGDAAQGRECTLSPDPDAPSSWLPELRGIRRKVMRKIEMVSWRAARRMKSHQDQSCEASVPIMRTYCRGWWRNAFEVESRGKKINSGPCPQRSRWNGWKRNMCVMRARRNVRNSLECASTGKDMTMPMNEGGFVKEFLVICAGIVDRFRFVLSSAALGLYCDSLNFCAPQGSMSTGLS